MATTTMSSTADSAASRFAVACGVLSQYVKAATPMPMPASGARVQELGQAALPADAAQQLTIFYGGRVVVLEVCTPARAAELIRYAAAAAASPAPAPALVDMPIARKASLQRFLSKRKDRGAAVAVAAAVEPPYGLMEEEESPAPAPPAKKGKAAAASSWLALGSLGDMHAQ